MQGRSTPLPKYYKSYVIILTTVIYEAFNFQRTLRDSYQLTISKGPHSLEHFTGLDNHQDLCPFYKIRTTSVPPSKMKLKNPNYMLLSNLSVGSWFHLNNISFIETFEKAKITTFMIPCSSSYPHCTGRAVIKVNGFRFRRRSQPQREGWWLQPPISHYRIRQISLALMPK